MHIRNYMQPNNKVGVRNFATMMNLCHTVYGCGDFDILSVESNKDYVKFNYDFPANRSVACFAVFSVFGVSDCVSKYTTLLCMMY